MHLQTTPIYYVKYRNEESKDKALRELINVEGVAEVSGIEEGIVNMRRSVTIEQCFENEETHKTTKKRKTLKWLTNAFKERRRNYIKGNMNLKQQQLKDTFAAKR